MEKDREAGVSCGGVPDDHCTCGSSYGVCSFCRREYYFPFPDEPQSGPFSDFEVSKAVIRDDALIVVDDQGTVVPFRELLVAWRGLLSVRDTCAVSVHRDSPEPGRFGICLAYRNSEELESADCALRGK